MRWTRKKLIIFQFMLWLITFAVMLPLMAQKLVVSPMFYNSVHFAKRGSKFVDKLNIERYTHARNYLKSLNSEINKEQHTRSLQSATMVAVIITKRRGICSRSDYECEPHYLQQVLVALDEDMKIFASSGTNKENFLPIVICNVDKDWGAHLDFSLVRQQFPTVLHYNNESNTGSNSNSRSKESLDYAFCLDSVLKLSNPKYVMVLEDDALSFQGIFEKIFYILNFRVEHKMSRDDVSENEQWGWIKLYYPELWAGFGLEESKIIELISVALFGALIHYLIVITLIRTKLVCSFIFVYSIQGAMYILLMVLVMGRQTFLEMRRLHSFFIRISSDRGCCTPAVLYSTKWIPEIVSYLQSSKCHRCHLGVDLALSDFSENMNLPCHLVEPSLFRHIGMHSTLTANKDPRSFLFYDFLYTEISNLIVQL